MNFDNVNKGDAECMSFCSGNVEIYDTEVFAGQRLMAGFDGTEFNKDIEYLIGKLKIGGLILFAANIETPDQVKQLCFSAQEYALSLGLPPLFIAIDQEGGKVARLRPPFFTHFPGNSYIKNTKQAVEFAKTTAFELLSVNVNMNLAPVVDFIPEGFDSIMEGRAFNGTPDEVAKLGACVIEEMQKHGIMACAKHFPGIGRTAIDSHFHLPIIDSDLEFMEKNDFIPFAAAIKSGVSSIMLSHILYPEFDDKWPASLSPVIVKNLLRNKMGFQGLVMTDDLDMKAIKYDIKVCVKQILASEVDIALICHSGPDIETAFFEIYKLISENENLYESGKKSVKRIIEAKNQYLGHLSPRL